jgi:hypothetical protein
VHGYQINGAWDRYRIPTSQPATGTESALPGVAGPQSDGPRTASPLSKDSPLLVFGVLAAVTFGLMAASTTVRVGGTSASVRVGDAGGDK